MRSRLLISALLCLALFGAPARAQKGSVSLGFINSPRGFGLSSSIAAPEGKNFSSVFVYADIYGVPTGRCDEPGVKAAFIRNLCITDFDLRDASVELFAGPGVCAGFVKDYEPGYALGITRNHGLCAALAGDIGLRVSFPRGVRLDLFFEADLGFHMRRHEDAAVNNLAVYKNGLIQSFWPSLSILFDL